MEEQEQNKKIFFYSLIATVIVVCFAIFMLIKIWSPNENNNIADSQVETSSSNEKLGTYKDIIFSQDKQVLQYVSLLTNYLRSSDTGELYNLLNSDYKEYEKINLEKLKSKLESKNLLGKDLTSSSYKYAKINGNKVFVIPLTSKNDSSILENIVITEYSPKNYAIAFDDFVYYKKDVKTYTRENISLNIYDQVAYVTSYSAKVKLRNISDDVIVLNNSNNYEISYLRLSDNTELLTNKTFLSGERINLTKNKEMNFSVSFQIPELKHSMIKTLILKDFLFEKNNVTRDLEFDVE